MVSLRDKILKFYRCNTYEMIENRYGQMIFIAEGDTLTPHSSLLTPHYNNSTLNSSLSALRSPNPLMQEYFML